MAPPPEKSSIHYGLNTKCTTLKSNLDFNLFNEENQHWRQKNETGDDGGGGGPAAAAAAQYLPKGSWNTGRRRRPRQ